MRRLRWLLWPLAALVELVCLLVCAVLILIDISKAEEFDDWACRTLPYADWKRR